MKKKTACGLETRAFEFRLDDVDEEEGIITGYASVFNELLPSYIEMVAWGAFKKSL